MVEAAPVPTTVVTGARASDRENCIASAIAAGPASRIAVLIEGMPDGRTVLEEGPDLHVARVASGCLCCTGNLVMKVTLNRLLRLRPSRIYIGVANSAHLSSLRELLSSPQYATRIQLEDDLAA